MKATKFFLAVLAFGVLSSPASAQYFGQNKVQYRTFDWQIIQNEHFDVYFYPVEREAALDVARIAERSYARLSRILHHNFIERKPILLYASYSEFQETNALGGESPSEGTEGVTEFFKHRMVIPFTGSYEAMEHVIQHEMTHHFQYDVYSHSFLPITRRFHLSQTRSNATARKSSLRFKKIQLVRRALDRAACKTLPPKTCAASI